MRVKWLLRTGLALGLVVSISACADDGDGAGNGDLGAETGDGDGDVGDGAGDGAGGDGGGDGDGDGDGDGAAAPWSFEPIYGVTNFDDDLQSNKRDWFDPAGTADDDLAPVEFSDAALAELQAGDKIRFTMGGNAEAIRFWDGNTPVMGANSGETILLTYTVTYQGTAPALMVEFGDYLASGTLRIEHLDADDNVIDSDDIVVMSSPLILNHHLQPLERAWVLGVNNNQSMIADFASVLGSRFTESSGYSGDVWLQDEPQFGTQTGNHGERADIIIDSVRDRGLDDWPEDTADNHTIVDTWGNPQQANTFDSFGNLEVTPPITVDGTDYPFGRIYYGREGNVGLNTTLGNFLASQTVQAPVEIDTTWLCVGHVDEFSTFIPDPNSEKGFKLLFADTRSAYDLLSDLPGTHAMSRYQQAHGVGTVSQLRTDKGLETLNDEIQTLELDPLLEKFKTEFGLTDDDIILIPTLFEECGSYSVALTPGMVNLIVANPEGETPTLLVPDPYFRANGETQADDPFIQAFADAMPEGLDLVFTDNFYTYHVNLGEVHCGTAVQRPPDQKPWWDAAAHLLGLEEK